MTRTGLSASIGIFALFGFLAMLAWTGPMTEAVGRNERFFAVVVNAGVGWLGPGGAAALFAGTGAVLALLAWRAGRAGA